jgi:shikimate kinase
MASDVTRPIALIGLMGAGKSAVANALCRRLGCEATDLDARIEASAGTTGAEVFAREGEAGFRRRETAALEAALAEGTPVIATGGGVVVTDRNRELLGRQCLVVWLEVDPVEAARRIPDGASRPMLAGGSVERFRTLLEARAPLYEAIAEIRVRTDGRSADEVAEAILSLIATRRKEAS